MIQPCFTHLLRYLLYSLCFVGCTTFPLPSPAVPELPQIYERHHDFMIVTGIVKGVRTRDIALHLAEKQAFSHLPTHAVSTQVIERYHDHETGYTWVRVKYTPLLPATPHQ